MIAHSLIKLNKISGTMFCITVFSKKMGVDDAVLGIISTTSKIAGSLVLAFARNNVEVYMGN